MLIGSFMSARWWTVVAAAGVILAALYLLWAYQRVFHGEPDEENTTFRELILREGLVLLPFIAAIVFVGVYPKPMLDRIEPSVDALDRARRGEDRLRRARARRPNRRRRASDLRTGSGHVQWPRGHWWALSPLIVLLGGAMFLLLAGALTPVWPRGLYAAITSATAVAAAVLAMIQWDDITDEGVSTLVGGALAFDTFSMFFTITACVAVLLVALISDDYLRREGLDGPEYYALYLVAAVGGSRDGVGQRPDRPVPRSGDALPRLLRPRRRSPASHEEPGSGHQVLHPRRLRLGVPAVRHCSHLRRRRVDEHHRDRRPPAERRAGGEQRRPDPCRHRPPPRRARVQGLCRAVPHLGARRLRRCAITGHGIHGRGRQRSPPSAPWCGC